MDCGTRLWPSLHGNTVSVSPDKHFLRCSFICFWLHTQSLSPIYRWTWTWRIVLNFVFDNICDKLLRGWSFCTHLLHQVKEELSHPGFRILIANGAVWLLSGEWRSIQWLAVVNRVMWSMSGGWSSIRWVLIISIVSFIWLDMRTVNSRQLLLGYQLTSENGVPFLNAW